MAAVSTQPQYTFCVEFEWRKPFQTSAHVYGDWNNWDKASAVLLKAHAAVSSAFPTAFVQLSPGDYKYRFIVDGQSVVDSTKPTSSLSDGAPCNVVVVSAESDSHLYDVGPTPIEDATGASHADLVDLVIQSSVNYLSPPIRRIPILSAAPLTSSLRVNLLHKNKALRLDLPPAQLFQVRGNVVEAFIDFGRVCRIDSIALRGLFDAPFHPVLVTNQLDNKYLLTIKYHSPSGDWRSLFEDAEVMQTFLNALPHDDSVASKLALALGTHISAHRQSSHQSQGVIYVPTTAARRLIVQLRVMPRELSPLQASLLTSVPSRTFRYSSDFDTNGLLYWIGTNGGRDVYENPALGHGGQIKLEISHSRMSRPSRMSRESIVAHTYSSSQPIYWGGSSPIWFSIDLGSQRRFRVSAYSLRHGYHSANSFLQNWEFQCSQDGHYWTTVHAGMQSGFTKAFDTKTFFVDGAHTSVEASRYFRVLQRGSYGTTPSSLHHNAGNSLMCIAGFELYGDLFTVDSTQPLVDAETKANTLNGLQISFKSFEASAPLAQSQPETPSVNQAEAQKFTFDSDFDTNGVLYFLGTSGGKNSSWLNPAKPLLGSEAAATVAIEISDSALAHPTQVSKEAIIGRNAHSLDVLWGLGSQEQRWMMLDLSQRHRLRCTHFTIRNGLASTKSIVKYSVQSKIELQGSHDGESWSSLGIYDLDTTFRVTPHASTTTNITTASESETKSGEFFRYFKIVDKSEEEVKKPQPPKSSDEDESEEPAVLRRIMSIGGLELYGDMLVSDEEEELESNTPVESRSQCNQIRAMRNRIFLSKDFVKQALDDLISGSLALTHPNRAKLLSSLLETCRFSLEEDYSNIIMECILGNNCHILNHLISNDIVSGTPESAALLCILLLRALPKPQNIERLSRELLKSVTRMVCENEISGLFLHDNGKALLSLLKWSLSHLHDLSSLATAASSLAQSLLSFSQSITTNISQSPQYRVLRFIFGCSGNALENHLFCVSHGERGSPIFDEVVRSTTETPSILTFEHLDRNNVTEDAMKKELAVAQTEHSTDRSDLLKVIEPLCSPQCDFAEITSTYKRSEILGVYKRCLESLNTVTLLQTKLARHGVLPQSTSILDRTCWISKEIAGILRDLLNRFDSSHFAASSSLSWILGDVNFIQSIFTAFCVDSRDAAYDRCIDLISLILTRSPQRTVKDFIFSVCDKHFGASEIPGPEHIACESLGAILKSSALRPAAVATLLELISSNSEKSHSESPWLLLLLSSLLLTGTPQLLHRHSVCKQCGTTPIRGTRWRCLQCPDYDLCSSCEQRQHRSHAHDPTSHFFVQMTHPLPFEPTNEFMRNNQRALCAPFTLQKEKVSSSAVVHAGTKCSSCGVSPILGTRWQSAYRAESCFCERCGKLAVEQEPIKNLLIKIDRVISPGHQLILTQLHPWLYPSVVLEQGKFMASDKSAEISALKTRRVRPARSLSHCHRAMMRHHTFPGLLEIKNSDGLPVFSALWHCLKSAVTSPLVPTHALLTLLQTLQQLAHHSFSYSDISCILSQSVKDFVDVVLGLVDYAIQSGSAPSGLIRSELINLVHILIGQSIGRLSEPPRSIARLRRKVRNFLTIQLMGEASVTKKSLILEIMYSITSERDLESEETRPEIVSRSRSSSCSSSAGPRVSAKGNSAFGSIAKTLCELLASTSISDENSPERRLFSLALGFIGQLIAWAKSRSKMLDLLITQVSFPVFWNAIKPCFDLSEAAQAVLAQAAEPLLSLFVNEYALFVLPKLAAAVSDSAKLQVAADKKPKSIKFLVSVFEKFHTIPRIPAEALPNLLIALSTFIAEAYDDQASTEKINPAMRPKHRFVSLVLGPVEASVSGATREERGRVFARLSESIGFTSIEDSIVSKNPITSLLQWLSAVDTKRSKARISYVEKVLKTLLSLAESSESALESVASSAFQLFKSKPSESMVDILVALARLQFATPSASAMILAQKLKILDYCIGHIRKEEPQLPVSGSPPRASKTAAPSLLTALHLNHSARKIAAQEAIISRMERSLSSTSTASKKAAVVSASTLTSALPIVSGLEELNSLCTVSYPSAEAGKIQHLLRSDALSLGLCWVCNFGSISSVHHGAFGQLSSKQAHSYLNKSVASFVLELPMICRIKEVRISFSSGSNYATPDAVEVQTATALSGSGDNALWRSFGVSVPSKEKKTTDQNLGGFARMKSETISCSGDDACRLIRFIIYAPSTSKSALIYFSRVQVLGHVTPYPLLSPIPITSPDQITYTGKSNYGPLPPPGYGSTTPASVAVDLSPSCLRIMESLAPMAAMLTAKEAQRVSDAFISSLDMPGREAVLLKFVEACPKFFAPSVFERILQGTSTNQKTPDILGRVLAVWGSEIAESSSLADTPWRKLIDRVFDPYVASTPLMSAAADALQASKGSFCDSILDLQNDQACSLKIEMLLRLSTPLQADDTVRFNALRLLCTIALKTQALRSIESGILRALDTLGPTALPPILVVSCARKELAKSLFTSKLYFGILAAFKSAELTQAESKLAQAFATALLTAITLSSYALEWVSSSLLHLILDLISHPKYEGPSYAEVLRILASRNAEQRSKIFEFIAEALRREPSLERMKQLFLYLSGQQFCPETRLYVRLVPAHDSMHGDHRAAFSHVSISPQDIVRVDTEITDPSIEISKDKQTVTVPQGVSLYQWRSVFSETGISRGSRYWEVVVESCPSNSNIIIGVCEKPQDPIPCIAQNMHLQCWAWSGNGVGQLYHLSQLSSGYGKGALVQGDIIGVFLDLDAGTLSYRHNGEDLGIAFSNIFIDPDKSLYLGISIFTPNTVLRLQSGYGPSALGSSQPTVYGIFSSLSAISSTLCKVLEVPALNTISWLQSSLDAGLDDKSKHAVIFARGSSVPADQTIGSLAADRCIVDLEVNIEDVSSSDNATTSKSAVAQFVMPSQTAPQTAEFIRQFLTGDQIMDYIYSLCHETLVNLVAEEHAAARESTAQKLLQSSSTTKPISTKQRSYRRSPVALKQPISAASLLDFLELLHQFRLPNSKSPKFFESLANSFTISSLLCYLVSRVECNLFPSQLERPVPELDEVILQHPFVSVLDAIFSCERQDLSELPAEVMAALLGSLTELADLAPRKPDDPFLAAHVQKWTAKNKAREQLRRLQREVETSKASSNSKPWAKGTGYGTESDDTAASSDASGWNHERYMRSHAITQRAIVNIIRALRMLFDGSPLQADILLASCFTQFLESYLRNDSMLDMERAALLYVEIFQFVADCTTKHVAAARKLFFSPLRQDSSDSIHSLFIKLHKLSSNMDTVIKRGLQSEETTESVPASKEKKANRRPQKAAAPKSQEQIQAEISLLSHLRAAVDALDALADADSHAGENGSTGGSGVFGDSTGDLESKYVAEMEELLFGEFDLTNPAASSSNLRERYSEHHYNARICQEMTPAAAKMKRLVNEISALSVGLPLHSSSSVFLRVDAERLDVMKCAITGPKDTPYENGFFVFDIFCPADYPAGPPLVNLQTTGNGAMRFNPNLYNCGKVCLSLLGTWRGGPNEQWNESTSTLLQVFVSIQSLILVDQPYFNEPGYEASMGTDEGRIMSGQYNETIRLGTLRWAILEQLKSPSKGFEEVILKHFSLKKQEILKQCDNWLRETKLALANPSKPVSSVYGSVATPAQSQANYEKLKHLCAEVRLALDRLGQESLSTSVTNDDTMDLATQDQAAEIARWVGTDELIDAFPQYPLGLYYKALEINKDQLHESLEWLFTQGDQYLANHPHVRTLKPPEEAHEAMTERQLRKLTKHQKEVANSASSSSSLPSVASELEDFGAVDNGGYEYNSEDESEPVFF